MSRASNLTRIASEYPVRGVVLSGEALGIFGKE